MKYKLSLFTLVCMLIISCSSDEQLKFEQVVTQIDKYFSSKPVLLTSKKIIKKNEEVFSYYALKIIDYDLSYNIIRSSYAFSPYTATVTIICNAVNNSKSGDLISDISEFQTELGIRSKDLSGFSTTNMALANNNFAENSTWTMFIRYSYRNDRWTYDNVAEGPESESFISDLEDFPQNENFRKAIGMADS